MKISNDYTIHKTQQIIDINNGLKQFTASVQIMSENDQDEFEAQDSIVEVLTDTLPKYGQKMTVTK